jgi:hypothetical protein
MRAPGHDPAGCSARVGRRRRIWQTGLVLTCSLLLNLLAPARADAWWDFIEEFSGPQKFWGPDVQLRLFCVAKKDEQVKIVAPPPVGIILSLCDGQTEKNKLVSFDLGARFMWSKKYKGDSPADFANGETIFFTTLEPAVMFPVYKNGDFRLEYGFGAGVYWFSSKGFEPFHGAFIEPARLDVVIPVSAGKLTAIVGRVGLLNFPAGFGPLAFAGGPGHNTRIASDWVPVYSVFAQFNLSN